MPLVKENKMRPPYYSAPHTKQEPPPKAAAQRRLQDKNDNEPAEKTQNQNELPGPMTESPMTSNE